MKKLAETAFCMRRNAAVWLVATNATPPALIANAITTGYVLAFPSMTSTSLTTDSQIPWLTCCAVMVAGKKDETGGHRAWNKAGKEIDWIAPEEFAAMLLTGPPAAAPLATRVKASPTDVAARAEDVKEELNVVT